MAIAGMNVQTVMWLQDRKAADQRIQRGHHKVSGFGFGRIFSQILHDVKINFSPKFVITIAVLNLIFVVGFFHWFISRRDTVQDMVSRCNAKVLESNLIGKSMPKYEFANTDGIDSYQELMQDKVVIIIFLTNCEACLKEFEMLESHADEIISKVKLVAITGEASGVVKRFVDERKLSFPIYLDIKGSMMLKEHVSCTPTTLFLENGTVTKVKVGVIEYKDLIEGI